MTPFDFARTVRDYAGRMRAARRHIRTERALDSLPADLRKDIGWPDRFDGHAPFRH